MLVRERLFWTSVLVRAYAGFRPVSAVPFVRERTRFLIVGDASSVKENVVDAKISLTRIRAVLFVRREC